MKWASMWHCDKQIFYYTLWFVVWLCVFNWASTSFNPNSNVVCRLLNSWNSGHFTGIHTTVVYVCVFKFVVQMISWYSIKWRNYQRYSKFPTILSPHNELSFQYGIPFNLSDERTNEQTSEWTNERTSERGKKSAKAHLLCLIDYITAAKYRVCEHIINSDAIFFCSSIFLNQALLSKSIYAFID